VTETATETVTVTASASSTGKNVMPVQSSSAAYYPTGSSSVVHGLPSSGFLTKAKPTGVSPTTSISMVGTAAPTTKSIPLFTGPLSDSYAIPTEFSYAPEASSTSASEVDAVASSSTSAAAEETAPSYSAPAAYAAPAAYGRRS
jgi:hypothetical protein